MSHGHYDRLSALDATFLDVEDGSSHMHIGSVSLFDARPLRGPEAELDFERILDLVRWTLQSTVRFRQKLAIVPGLGQPVWIDDDRFNLRYHVRHTALPAPGNLRQLKRMAGRVVSQQLDRSKPLWELWVVEGVEGDRIALIWKIHHCLADGISGTEVTSAMMGTDPEYRPGPARPFVARPAPSGARLLADELRHRAELPMVLLDAGRKALFDGGETLRLLRNAARGLGEGLSAAAHPASETPFNTDLGPHRRFDWTELDLAAAREVRQRLGGKLNDVVLCVVAGAVGRFLRGRGLDTAGLDFRVMVPISVRRDSERKSLGNRVSQMLVRLPVDEPDPRRRLAQVTETTSELKQSGQHHGMELLSQIADATGPGILPWLTRAGIRARAANLVVTNVPGPPEPVFMLGARLEAVYPLVPLAGDMAAGIALFSYAGKLYWGFNVDWDAFPDLHDLVEAVDLEFEALRKSALEAAPADARDA